MNAYIEISDNEVFGIFSTRKLSISVWMRPGTLTFPFSEGGHGDYVYWIGNGQDYGTNSGDQEWARRMYNLSNNEDRPNRTSFYVFNPPGGLGAGSYVQDAVTPLVWIHFAATVDVDADMIKWYKNGVLSDFDPPSGYTIVPKNDDAPLL